jgi:hypothetical protein
LFGLQVKNVLRKELKKKFQNGSPIRKKESRDFGIKSPVTTSDYTVRVLTESERERIERGCSSKTKVTRGKFTCQ